MTTLPDVRPRYAMHPLTGEAVALQDEPTDTLARLRDEIRDAKTALDEWGRQLDAELTARLDHEARRSATIGGYTIKTTAPTTRETDAQALRLELHKLVRAGVISMEAVDAAVEVETVFKAKRAGLNALHRHADERVRAAAAAHDREVENPVRYVSVTRVA